MNWMGYKLLHFVSFFNSWPCLIPLSEPEPSKPKPELHRVTAPAAAPTKRCGSLRLRLKLRLRITVRYSVYTVISCSWKFFTIWINFCKSLCASWDFFCFNFFLLGLVEEQWKNISELRSRIKMMRLRFRILSLGLQSEKFKNTYCTFLCGSAWATLYQM
jgi:hypothetical protein